MKWAVLPILAVLASCGPASPGSGRKMASGSSIAALLPDRPEKGTLFSDYKPRFRSAWNDNWTSKLDLSGVSWNDNRAATLISPFHVVMASHFMRGADTTFIFHDRAGRPHERTLIGSRVLPGTDIAVGKLDRPLPRSVKFYGLATLAQATPGKHVITTDQTMTLSVHRINAVHGAGIAFDHDPGLDPIYRRELIPGDSGHPTFLLEDGELGLLETHTIGGAGAGPFYGDPGVQAAIRAAVADLDKDGKKKKAG